MTVALVASLVTLGACTGPNESVYRASIAQLETPLEESEERDGVEESDGFNEARGNPQTDRGDEKTETAETDALGSDVLENDASDAPTSLAPTMTEAPTEDPRGTPGEDPSETPVEDPLEDPLKIQHRIRWTLPYSCQLRQLKTVPWFQVNRWKSASRFRD